MTALSVARLLLRLAWRDLTRRRVEAALLVAAIATATTTLTVGLAVRAVADQPWQRAHAATAGPDVVATAWRDAPASLDALGHAAGVRASAGPFPVVNVTDLRVRDITLTARVQGRDEAPAPVDQPRATEGGWVRSGEAVVERAFATALRLRVGDPISVAGVRLRVGGVAVSTAQAPYPDDGPGLVWVSRADLRRLTAAEPLTGYQVLSLRLADPAAAPAFAAAHSSTDARRKGPGVWARPWQAIRDYGSAELTVARTALLTGVWLLAALATASVAVLVGGRMAEQRRRVGLLKAVGATPRLVAGVLLAEHTLLALAATAIGLVAGWLASPAFTRPSAGVLAAPNPPPVSWASAALVALLALTIVAVATVAPAARAARTSTVRALAQPARPPRRAGALIAVSARLPAPLLLGTRLVARRPRRTALATLSMTLAVAAVVAALAIRHAVDAKNAVASSDWFVPGMANPVTELLGQVVIAFMAALLALAAVNVALVTWATGVDAVGATALARALGMTSRQVSLGLAAAQLLPALTATIGGVPLGLALYAAVSGRGGLSVPVSWLVALAPATLVVTALLSAAPVRLHARRPVGALLRSS